jgi:hypothetical protein
LGDFNGALPFAEKALSLDANNARYHLRVATICISLGQQAGIFKGMGMAHRFREEAEKAIALDPQLIDAREALMEFYFRRSGHRRRRQKKASATADEIARIDPTRGLLAQASLSALEKNLRSRRTSTRKLLLRRQMIFGS